MLDMTPALSRAASPPKVNLRQIALPTEHGSWGFLFEPIVAALAISFSLAGVWVSLLVIGAFLARRPFQVLVLQRQGGRRPIIAAAFKLLLCFCLIAIIGAVGAVVAGGAKILIPFLAATPVAIFQIYIETTRRGRQFAAEIAGALIMPSSAAAIITAGGGTPDTAAAVWLFFTARFIPSILYVRSRLDLEKGKPHSVISPVLTHSAALAAIILLAASGRLTWLSVAVFLLLFTRCCVGLSRYRRRIKAMKIGIWEVIYGAILVASLIIGHYTGW